MAEKLIPHTHERGLVLWTVIGKHVGGKAWHILLEPRKPGPRSHSVLWEYPCLCGNVIPDAVQHMSYHARNTEEPFCHACFTIHNERQEFKHVQ